jgi:chromosome partitioning protein
VRVWSVVSQKGGSGKTTLVLQVAIAATASGLAVSVIDLDPQKSAEQWSKLRELLAPSANSRKKPPRRGLRAAAAKRGKPAIDPDEPAIVSGVPLKLDEMLATARETGTDIALIDTAPQVDKTMIYAAAAAGMIIIPTRTGILDQQALRETLDYIGRINMLSKTVVVFNAPSKDEAAKTEIAQMVTRDFGVRLLNVTLEDQPDIARALREGKGVTEFAPTKAAAKSVLKLYKCLCEFDQQIASARRRVPV